MSLLLFAIFVLIVLALVLYAVNLVPLPGPAVIKQLIQALIVLIAAFVIAQRAGLV